MMKKQMMSLYKPNRPKARTRIAFTINLVDIQNHEKDNQKNKISQKGKRGVSQ